MIDDATRSYLKPCYAAKFLYFPTLLNEFHETWLLFVHYWFCTLLVGSEHVFSHGVSTRRVRRSIRASGAFHNSM